MGDSLKLISILNSEEISIDYIGLSKLKLNDLPKLLVEGIANDSA